MALVWVSTGVDENGNETGYNIDNGSGDVWDSSGNLLDQSTAQPVDNSYYTSPEFLASYPEAASVGSDAVTAITGYLSKFGQSALDKLKSMYTKTGTDGKPTVDWKSIAATAGGLYGLYQSQQQKDQPKTGYQGGIPHYAAVREQVSNTYDPNRRAGSSGQTYFTNTHYATAADAPAAQTEVNAEAKAAEAKNKENPARETKKMASGGLAALAQGRYLGGPTDGMADKIPAKIDGKQEARLSHGEFVVPADVVGHLGNGNSDAGAQRLYSMMDRIRKARTGTTKQGKQINPDKFLPA